VNHFQYTGDIKMEDNKQLTEQELDDISGGPHMRTFNGIADFMQYSDSFDKNGSGSTWKKDKPVYRPNTGIIAVLIAL